MPTEVTLWDGRKLTIPENWTFSELAQSVWNGQQADLVAAKLDGKLVDLSSPIGSAGGEVSFVEAGSPEGLEVLRHSTSHLMAQAVQQLFPEVKVTIGPAIENGFYYDFDYEKSFTPEDLERIEQRMRELVRMDIPVHRRVMQKAEALEFFRKRGEPYKVELIEEMGDQEVSLYEQGDFVDLCRGPHVPSTGRIRAFKLTKVAGAYWRGDERNPMLQRIYGTAFSTQEALEEYLKWLEEAERRDHRRLGRQLDLFSFSDEAGAGLVIYHPRGAVLRWVLEEIEKKEHLKRGYQMVIGPQMLRAELWERSGHMDYYRDFMYFTEKDGQSFAIKPMNCLAHMLIFNSRIRSYRDLPIRYFELGTVHRHEKTGVRHGLLRARGFTQDDAHLFCAPHQLQEEIKGILSFVKDMMGLFGFPFELEISTRPEKAFGQPEVWDRATIALKQGLEAMGYDYKINEGEGAFYGPKIDVKLRDALQRSWQCATIQCDFFLPERFDLTYVDADGQRKRPVMLHRVILGSLERFIGILIEHYAGAFPVWLAPVQATVINITDAQRSYAQQVATRLRDEGFRVEEDLRNEKLGLKIRENQLQKVPYMLVVGNREMAQGGVSVRSREEGDLGFFPLEGFLERIRMESRVSLG
ncbi:MAG: threonine--tRNA ligase [bacterium]